MKVETNIQGVDNRLKELGEQEQEYNELVRRQKEKLDYYDQYNRSLIAARTRLQVDEGQYGTHVDVLQYAIEPASPYYVPRIRMALACIAGGIALGIALMFSLEYCDRSFRDMEDAAAYLEVPVLGSICTIAPARETKPLRRRKLLSAGLLTVVVILLGVAAIIAWDQLNPGAPGAFLRKFTTLAHP